MRSLIRALERRRIASNRSCQLEFTEIELDTRKGKTGKTPGLNGTTQEMLARRIAACLSHGRSGTNHKKRQRQPTTLTSVISKTMECMVNARLYHHLEQSACRDESQSGFRRHRATVDQLVRLTQSVINA
ncbi:RNA-directed DNA polymerase from mobile element jockey [Plakobranchus ocellatus]|uniref:RNA-directed DNA polymerase from mobile element jockey n=1 Tax=Plakobranchus ocellatus TaxID=259542 RepID=A0AAV3Z4P8_9GAST|nr:RNA-directed DNA polymerase from mobile element jockey [Plakobranchus ocellatus]